ncbi:MAG: hypothetical protein KC482_13705 [Dehalococcoidia bacterium]|nr:hypothetical protein [Dehalococcoidia bacterium]MCA9854623.1 hypothetical protein [Dehalococcoidia bacterium]
MWDELVAQYGNQLDMVVVDRDSPEGRAFSVSHGIGYQPGFVVIDPRGEVYYAALGPYTGEELTQLIEEAAAL